MINNLSLKLAMLGCAASCLVSVAHADNPFTDESFYLWDTGDQTDIVFVDISEGMFPDVACVPDPIAGINGVQPSPLPAVSTVAIDLQSNIPADIRLYNIHFLPFADDNSGISFDFSTALPNNCVTSTDPVTNAGNGVIDGFSSCTLYAQYVPPTCETTGSDIGVIPTPAPVPTQAGSIHQLLVIGVGSQEDFMLLEASSDVTAIGSGSQFAVLGFNQAPVNQGGGNTQAFGNVGLLPVGHPGGFTLPAYAQEYFQGPISAMSPVVLGAEADLENAYAVLTADLENGIGPNEDCLPYGDFNNGAVIPSGSYCLSNADTSYTPPRPIDVTLDGTITLAGAGNFYFYADTAKECAVTLSPLVTRMCNFVFGSDFNIQYAADGNGNTPSAENVFWILNRSSALLPLDTTPISSPVMTYALGSTDFNHVFIYNGARIDGSILGGGFATPGAAYVPPGPPTPNTCLATSPTTGPYVGNNIIVEPPATGDRAVVVNGTIWSACGEILLSGTTVSPTL